MTVHEILANPAPWLWNRATYAQITPLALRAQQGDEQAKEELLKRYTYRLAKQAQAFQPQGSPEDLEDLMSEARVAFMESIRDFSPSRGVFTSLVGFMVLRRLSARVKGILRERRLTQASSTRFLGDFMAYLDTQDEPLDPRETAEREELYEKLRTLVAALPQEDRTLLELIYDDGATLREVSNWTQLPLPQLSAQLEAVVKGLKKELDR